MQSFLQYRRFRATLQAQLERNNLRTAQHDPDQEVGNKEWPSPEASSSDGAHDTDLEHGRALRDISEESEEKEDIPRESHESELEKEEEEHGLPIPENSLSRTTTQQSQGTALGRTLTGIEVRRRKTHEGGDGNVFVVGYEGPNDPMNPKSWSRTKRFAVTFSVASIGCVVGLASSIDSSAVKAAAAEFHVSEVVESMATGLFLIGEFQLVLFVVSPFCLLQASRILADFFLLQDLASAHFLLDHSVKLSVAIQSTSLRWQCT
jgi:hypothetical protein